MSAPECQTPECRICDCYEPDRKEAKRLAKMKVVKPRGYTWQLWSDPGPRKPRKAPMSPLRTPAWAYEGPAYKRFLAESDTVAAAARRDRLYREWFASRREREVS
jgi:hypothetical protein